MYFAPGASTKEDGWIESGAYTETRAKSEKTSFPYFCRTLT
jgi:hypothetical protein